jgi:hypothetical protein
MTKLSPTEPELTEERKTELQVMSLFIAKGLEDPPGDLSSDEAEFMISNCPNDDDKRALRLALVRAYIDKTIGEVSACHPDVPEDMVRMVVVDEIAKRLGIPGGVIEIAERAEKKSKIPF